MKKLICPGPVLSVLFAALLIWGCSTGTGAIPKERDLSRWNELSWADFLDESYKSLLAREPELVSELGLDDEMGMDGTELNRYDPAYLEKTERLERLILETAENWEVSALSRDEKISRDVYTAYLRDRVGGQEYRYHSFLVSSFITSVNFSTQLFFTETLEVRSKKDAEKYIKRLWKVKKKMIGADEFIRCQEQEGIFLPRELFGGALNSVRNISDMPVDRLSFHKSFTEKVGVLDISETEKEDLIARSREACEKSVQPGYAILEKRLLSQKESVGTEAGASSLPRGEEYYDWCLAHHSGGNMTSRELHELGLRETSRLEGEMRKKFAALGYQGDLSLEQLFNRLIRENKVIPAERAAETHIELAEDAQLFMETSFSRFPRADLEVKTARPGGYYLSPSLNGSRPGVFYANDYSAPYYGLPTLTFHETYPGHHYQIAMAGEGDFSLFRRQVLFTGYAEGWALYAEKLMADGGYYQSDPMGELGYLQAMAFRAARLVVDTGLHIMGWSPGEAADFFQEKTGYSRDFARGQVQRYLSWPGQAVSYYAGFSVFEALREREEIRRGEDFDIKDFHDRLMEAGPMPIGLLEEGVFPIEKPALLIIDVQYAYLPYVINEKKTLENIAALKEEARQKGFPVIYIRNVDGRMREGSRSWQFHDRIKPEEGDIVIEKRFSNAFQATTLDRVLRELNIKTAVLTGLASTSCYLATVRGAENKGYLSVIVSDAHTDQNQSNIDYMNKAFQDRRSFMVMRTEEVDFSSFVR